LTLAAVEKKVNMFSFGGSKHGYAVMAGAPIDG
jgi:hypothetical protein